MRRESKPEKYFILLRKLFSSTKKKKKKFLFESKKLPELPENKPEIYNQNHFRPQSPFLLRSLKCFLSSRQVDFHLFPEESQLQLSEAQDLQDILEAGSFHILPGSRLDLEGPPPVLPELSSLTGHTGGGVFFSKAPEGESCQFLCFSASQDT